MSHMYFVHVSVTIYRFPIGMYNTDILEVVRDSDRVTLKLEVGCVWDRESIAVDLDMCGAAFTLSNRSWKWYIVFQCVQYVIVPHGICCHLRCLGLLESSLEVDLFDWVCGVLQVLPQFRNILVLVLWTTLPQRQVRVRSLLEVFRA
jgi:hypothetical protein